MRINKYVASKGWASRREADALILDGKILVNGKRAEIGQRVSKSDKVELVGNTKEKTYLAYYKGRGIISHSPAGDEIDITMRLEKDYGLTNIYPVGRLDKDSEGLMILTNDGRVTAPLLDSTNKTEKTYEVEVDKNVNNFLISHTQKGVDIEGYKTRPAKAEKKSDKRFILTLTEGKKHQIRRMCAALGFQVESLKRIKIANVELGKLKPNQYRKIEGAELQTLLKTLNIKN